MKVNKNHRKSMKIPRSEAADKSLGVFFMLNSILMVLGPPERLNKLNNRFFEKSENFKKITKNPDRTGPGRTRPDQAGPDR